MSPAPRLGVALHLALLAAGALVALGACAAEEKQELLAGSNLGGLVRAGHVEVIWEHDGTDVEPLGEALTAIPDVNGDGVPDLVSTDESAGSEPGDDAAVGCVSVLSGRNGKLLWTRRGEERGDGLGACVAPAGDVDKDGTKDIAVGAAQAGPAARRAPDLPWGVDDRRPGYVLVLSGRAGHVLRRIDGSYPGGEFGRAVVGLGDVDGDGAHELAVGAPRDGTVGPSAGMISIVSTRAGTSVLAAAPGDNDEAQLGLTLASLPDADQDGAADFAAGAYEPRANGLEYILGVRSGRDGTFVRPLLAAGEHVVGGLAVPDVDGDGTADVLVAMLQAFGEPGGNLARGVLLASKTHTALQTYDEPPYAPVRGQSGFQLGGRATDLRLAAGDVDGDGHGDIALGAFSRTLEPATVTVFSGSDAAMLLYVCNGVTTLPGGLALPGDLDGDDRADLVIGLDLPGARSSVVALRIELPVR